MYHFDYRMYYNRVLLLLWRLGTGKCANVNEFEKYAVTVENLSIPEQAKIVALGEATHGNKEFQQLKLYIFKIMVED